MASISRPALQIDADCPVRWTATQEKSLGKDYPLDFPDESAQPYVLRTYLQFLYLPEFINPLQCLVPSLLRVTPLSGPLFRKPDHPLHGLVAPLLLTPRDAGQKYRIRVPKILEDEGETPDAETNMVWYVYKFGKADIDESEKSEYTQEVAEERWRTEWLSILERREVMIQVLLHFLLLSLTEPPKNGSEFGDPLLLETQQEKEEALPSMPLHNYPFDVLEERLESFMDKLSMWQLTDSLEKIGTGGDPAPPAMPGSGKVRRIDERDRMQIFCEDIVEPLFRSTLPSHCALLRSKVFPHSPFSEESDNSMSSSSPERKTKRLKTSKASSRKVSPRLSDNSVSTRAMDRSRSLSITLEEERERSRSLSVGPDKMRKRALAREVSMTTAFKGKAVKTKSQPTMRSKKATIDASQQKLSSKVANKGKGKTLVAATPAKPKNAKSGKPSEARASSSQHISKLPALNLASASKEPVEGDGDDDEWMIASSPDVRLFTSGSTVGGWDSENDEQETDSGSREILVAETPIKGRTR